MRVCFLGSGRLACLVLEELLRSHHEVAGVVCPPKRPAGRGRKLRPCPVAEYAEGEGANLIEAEDVNSPSTLEALRRLAPEALVVADFGQILGPQILGLPPKGAMGVHPSLLPRHRGPAPVVRALLAGEGETGVTTFMMEGRVDAGPIALQERVPIEDDDDAQTLTEKLGRLGGKLAVRSLDLLERGELPRIPQDESRASYAPKVRKEEAWIDWREPARSIWNKVRAFVLWPVARTSWRGRELLVYKARPREGGREGKPGEILRIEEGIWVATGEGVLELLEVQTAGRRRMGAEEWVRGARIREGEVLGDIDP